MASVILGVLVGLATASLAVLIEYVSRGSTWFGDWTGWGTWAFVALVPVGMVVSWLINRRFGPGISGGGVSETMVGLSVHGGYLPTKAVFPKIFATAATLGTGGSGGREGPIVYIGGIIGSKLARMAHFDHDRIRSLVAAGAGAGIGASFNAPIAGMLFAMEVILGSFAIRHLSAVVITSVMAAVTADLLIGQELVLTSPPHTFGEPWILLLYTALAFLAVGVGLLDIKTEDFVARMKLRERFPSWLRPVMYGVVVGLLGVVWPESLGTGRTYLSGLLNLPGAGDYVWWSLAIIAIVKILTSVLTREGGGSAGEFMASLVVGGSLGAAFAVFLETVGGMDSINTGAFAIVGMAAMLATTARAPLTSVIIVFELTGNYELVLPLMLSAALATYLGDRFHMEGSYITKLRRDGIQLPTNEDIDLLDTVDVSDVMQEVDGVLHPWQSLADASEFFDISSHHGAPVVNDADELVGVLSLSDIARAGGPSRNVTVSEAMTRHPITITPEAPVSMALSRMAGMGVGRLPVLGGTNHRNVVGMFRRESVVNAYEYALTIAKDRELYRERQRIRSQPGADFFVVDVREGSPVANEPIANVSWPSDAVLVSVQRATAVLVPHGDTVLRIGDVLTAFGTPESRAELEAVVERDPSSVPE
jgi:chloride channel protein, CIC family